MDVHCDKNPFSNALTQGDQVTSPILWQCLYVIKTASEFCNLTYRVTKTHNDVEILIVFREGVLGVFGPPVEPISLTLDPKGRCLLSVLFKPLERVSIVNQESGQIEAASLLAMLRLVSGKGYVFCPGFPEKFVIGKACGRYVVFHKVPFKRYQSTHCLVYYKGQGNQQSRVNSSLCTLCPRCLQAAKSICALPNFSADAGTAAAHMTLQLGNHGQTKSDQKTVICSSNTTDVAIPLRDDKPSVNQLAADHVNGLSSQRDCLSSTDSSLSSEPQNRADLSSKHHISELDVNGNTEAAGSLTDLDRRSRDSTRHTNIDAKIQVLTQVLTNLMQQKSVDVYHTAPELAGIRNISGNTKKLSSDCLEKSRHRKRNVCHHCKKQYSSRARLLSHLQRHEALQGVWQHKFRQRKRCRKPSVLSVVHRMFRESKLGSAMSKERPAVLSEMSVRLFLRYLDDLISSQNGAASQEQHKYTYKQISAKKKNKSFLQSYVCEQAESGITSGTKCEQVKNGGTKFGQVEIGGTLGTTCSLKRSRCDYSPMHTLLRAAAIAEVGHEDKNHLFIPSSSSVRRNDEAGVSSISHASSVRLQTSEDSIPEKKPRKSSRLASKRARKNKIRTRDNHCCPETVTTDNSPVSQEQCMLTNLNLLSTVSLETAMRQAATHPQSPGATHSQSTTAVYSQSPRDNHLQSPAASHSQSAEATHSQSPASITLKSPMVAFPAGRKQMNIAASVGLSQAAVADLPAPRLLPKSVNISQTLLNSTSGGNVVISRCPETSGSLSNTGADAKSSRPPVPPLLFAGDTQVKGLLYPLLPPHRQHISLTVRPSTSLLRSLVTDNKGVTDNNKGLVFSETKPTTNPSVNDDCGAIDLSKPKLSYVNTSFSLSKERDADLSSLPGLPNNIAQLVASSSSSDSLHCFMLMANHSADTTEQKESQSLHSIIGDKQADSDLQARMFASARNYRLDTGATHAPHVQAVIASSSHTVQSGKAVKPGAQADEIQCGYKWSGSGGLVKERTQMVRELVPPDVMASFLKKPQLGSKASQPLDITMYKTSQPQAAGPQVLPSSLAAWCTQTQDSSASELALNLITNKLSENNATNSFMTGRNQKALGVVTASVLDWSPTSPGSILQNILRSSLANKSAVVDSSSDTPGSPQKMQPKTVILSLTRSSTPTSLSSTPTPPSHCSVSSPSLAAILRQPPATTACESSHMLAGSIDLVSSPVTYHHKLTTDASPLSLPSGVLIKNEPPDSASVEQAADFTELPVKTEQNASTERTQWKESSSHAQSSLSSMIMDLNTETTVKKCDAEKLKLAPAKTRHLATKNTSVRCKH